MHFPRRQVNSRDKVTRDIGLPVKEPLSEIWAPCHLVSFEKWRVYVGLDWLHWSHNTNRSMTDLEEEVVTETWSQGNNRRGAKYRDERPVTGGYPLNKRGNSGLMTTARFQASFTRNFLLWTGGKSTGDATVAEGRCSSGHTSVYWSVYWRGDFSGELMNVQRYSSLRWRKNTQKNLLQHCQWCWSTRVDFGHTHQIDELVAIF